MKTPIPYPGDNREDPGGFKAKARRHQSNFRINELKIDCVDPYGNTISNEHGAELMNFYSGLGVQEVARARYPRFKSMLHCNLLRSEHIPINLFGPFVSANHRQVLSDALGSILGRKIEQINDVIIEHAPSPATDYLNDRTSFDTFIDYTDSTLGRGALGVEVKYTEGHYTVGKKEAIEVANTESLYHKLTSGCGIFRPECTSQLISDHYRQIWRNHLLGESIVRKHPETYNHFTLITLYPQGNVRISEACKHYHEFLRDGLKDHFVPLTYELYLDSLSHYTKDPELLGWIEYCMRRYLVD